MRILYDIAFFIYALFYLPYLVMTRRWYPGFGIRFGFFPFKTRQKLADRKNIWVHAVSVGEVAAAAGLVRRLKTQHPGHGIVCSVTTRAGYELARTQLADTALVIPSPLDCSLTAAAFIRAVRPAVYIAMETELWPNLFRRLYKKGIPIAIVNGRISDKSFGRYHAIKFLFKSTLKKVRVFCMQSDMDAQRVIALGADPGRVRVVGNIKFEDGPTQGQKAGGPGIFKADERVWIAGSTHPGEEELTLAVYRKMLDAGLPWRLVIAPRHVERAPDVMALARRCGFEGRVFSTLTPSAPLATAEVLVVDAVGHLRGLYGQASLVFMGKSFRVGGGQNIIEPAFFAKSVIVGPLMENFRDVLARFKEDGAIVQVKDEREFHDAVLALARDEGRRTAMGKKAAAVVGRNKGALSRTLACIQQAAGLR